MTSKVSEGCPSGQREQTVNLPAIAYGGSNPPPSTVNGLRRLGTGSASRLRGERFAGLAQLVERQLSKLNVVGSNPSSRSAFFLRVARGRAVVSVYDCPDSSGVEHLLGKEEVVGSNPILGSLVKIRKLPRKSCPAEFGTGVG